MAEAKDSKGKVAAIKKIKDKLKKDNGKLSDTVDILNGRKPLVDSGKLKGKIINPKSDKSQDFKQFVESVEDGWNDYPGQDKNPYGNDKSHRPKITILEKPKQK